MSETTSWVKISQLPVRVSALRTVNYDNTILAFGKLSLIFIRNIIIFTIIVGGIGSSKDTIYQFDPSDEAWSLFGSMKYPRGQHSVDLVVYDEFMKYCI